MPAKNSIKSYADNGYYHVYNRGVAKNEIFLQDQDYAVFLHYLKDYLSIPKSFSPEEIAMMQTPYLLKNYYQEIELMAFCLMPNHFHLLIQQKHPRSIEGFMRSLCIRYSQYFNKTHDRVGPLYQGVYKGKLIKNDEYLWFLSRYIHRNPIKILGGQQLQTYSYSSYPTYLGNSKITWLNTGNILSQVKNYRNFVEDSAKNEPGLINDFILEEREDS